MCSGSAQAVVKQYQENTRAHDVNDALEGHDCAAVLQVPPPVREEEDCGHCLQAREGIVNPLRVCLLRTAKSRHRDLPTAEDMPYLL